MWNPIQPTEGEQMLKPHTSEATIACKCGKCQLILGDRRALKYLRCGCEDCRQALQWGHLNGATVPDDLPHLYYVRSDIIGAKGKQHMKVFKLRKDGRSSRLYCKECYSLMGIDHPNYKSEIFLIFPKHCKTNCDLSVPLTAIIFLNDYPTDFALPPSDVPSFYSLSDDQERKRFLSLPGNILEFPSEPSQGESFTSFLQDLGPVEILDLERGKNLRPD